MTYLEELFEKADRLHQDIRIASGNIYLGAKLYDTFTLTTIRPLLDIINACPNGRYKDYCFTKTDKDNGLYLTHIANCHDGIVAMQVAKLTAEIEGGHHCIVLPTATATDVLTQFCEHRSRTLAISTDPIPDYGKAVATIKCHSANDFITISSNYKTLIFPHYKALFEQLVLDGLRNNQTIIIVSDNVKLPYHDIVFL